MQTVHSKLLEDKSASATPKAISREIDDKLKSKWGISMDMYWHPLNDPTTKPELTFFIPEKHAGLYIPVVIDLLHKLKCTIYLTGELGSYMIPANKILHPFYAETFVTAEDAEWVIYSSHESTITFAGQLFINDLLPKLGNIREYINEW